MCLVHINVIENGFLKIYVRELCSAEVYVLKRGIRQAVVRDLDLLVYCRLKNAVIILHIKTSMKNIIQTF